MYSLWFDTNHKHVRPMAPSMDSPRFHRKHQPNLHRHVNTIGILVENFVLSIERRRSRAHPWLLMSFTHTRAHTIRQHSSMRYLLADNVIYHEISKCDFWTTLVQMEFFIWYCALQMIQFIKSISLLFKYNLSIQKFTGRKKLHSQYKNEYIKIEFYTYNSPRIIQIWAYSFGVFGEMNFFSVSFAAKHHLIYYLWYTFIKI